MHSILEIIEETTDSAGPDLISLDDLKLALGITGTTEDAQLQAMITFQSRIIADYCDRRLGRAEVLETFTFDPGETLPMRQGLVLSLYPVVQISEVSTAGATGADYHFDPASGRLWLPTNQYTGYWVYGPYNYGPWPSTVTVNYTGGYDLPEGAPPRLQAAVIQAVSEGRFNHDRDPTLRAVQHGDTRIEYLIPASVIEAALTRSGGLSKVVIELIQPYRRLHVA